MEPEGFTSKCCEVYNILYGHHSLGPCVMKLGNIALSLYAVAVVGSVSMHLTTGCA